VAYGSLPADERRRLHERAAEAIEAIFHDRLHDHYGALAHHYQRAGVIAKAVEYLGRAAQQAVQRSAYTEAVGQLRIALGMVAELPPDRERSQQELILQTALGAAIMATQGMGAPEIETIFSRARELCHEVGETPELFQVLQGLSVFYAMRVKLGTAEELLEQRRCLAERLPHPAFLPQAQIAHGHFLLARGDVMGARAELERGMALYDPRQHHTLAFGAGLDPSGRDHAALVLWLLGYPDRALGSLREVLAFVRTQPHPFSLAVGQIFAAMLHQLRREPAAVREWAEAAVATSAAHGFVMFSARSVMLRGWALSEQGQAQQGVAELLRGLDADRATGAELLRPYFLGLLAEAQAADRHVDHAVESVNAAIGQARTSGERWWEAELLRLKGALLLREHGPAEGTPVVKEAEAFLHEALSVSRRQHVKSLELRTATTLARLWREQGKREDACALLTPVCEWFTEGLDTRDLVDARTLLSALA
jgi:predicted ATPase